MNGTSASAPGGPAARLDYGQVREVLQRALTETERQLSDCERRIEQAQAEKATRLQEVRYLKRMLEIGPSASAPYSRVPDVGGRALGDRLAAAAGASSPGATPPVMKTGTRTGLGPGSQAGLYLLETARIRVAVNAEKRLPGLQDRSEAEQRAAVDIALDGQGALDEEAVALSCKGWKRSTVRDGMRWLLEGGLIARTGEREFRLTEAGWARGPAQPGTLPLREPREAIEGELDHAPVGGGAPAGEGRHAGGA